MTVTAQPGRTYNPISGTSCIAPTFADDLDVLARDLDAVIDSARSLANGVSAEQFNWKPSPVQWSMAQCIQHVALTGAFAANGQETAINKLKSAGRRSSGPYSYRGIPATMGGMLMKSVEPPVSKKYRTSKKVVPADRHDHDAVINGFVEVHQRLATLLLAAKGLDLGAASVPLAVPLFSMRLGQSLAFEIAHARRHIWQAKQVSASPQFPR